MAKKELFKKLLAGALTITAVAGASAGVTAGVMGKKHEKELATVEMTYDKELDEKKQIIDGLTSDKKVLNEQHNVNSKELIELYQDLDIAKKFIDVKNPLNTAKNKIEAVSDYIEGKDDYNKNDRVYVHSEIGSAGLLVEKLSAEGMITEEEYSAMADYIKTLQNLFVLDNVKQSMEPYMESDYYKIKMVSTQEDTAALTEVLLCSQDQACVYSSEDDGRYIVADNGTIVAVDVTGGYVEEVSYDDFNNVRIMELADIYSWLDHSLRFSSSAKIGYDENDDAYTVVVDSYQMRYDFDENGHLYSCEQSYNAESDDFHSTLMKYFSTDVTKESFDTTMAAVSQKVQEEKARIEDQQSQKQ